LVAHPTISKEDRRARATEGRLMDKLYNIHQQQTYEVRVPAAGLEPAHPSRDKGF